MSGDGQGGGGPTTVGLFELTVSSGCRGQRPLLIGAEGVRKEGGRGNEREIFSAKSSRPRLF